LSKAVIDDESANPFARYESICQEE